MNKVRKYTLDKKENVLEIPDGGKPLCVQMQHGAPQLWVQVNPGAQTTTRRFDVVGTGEAFDETQWKYIDTWQVNGGMIVRHCFEWIGAKESDND